VASKNASDILWKYYRTVSFFNLSYVYNVNMSIFIVFPIVLGILIALIINYLADVLPASLRLGQPTCANPDCRKPFKVKDYLLLRQCRHCGKPRGWRPYVLILLCLLSALFLWFSAPAKLGFLLSLLVLAYFYVVAVIDIEHHDILRSLSLIGLLLTALCGFLMHGWLSTLLGGVAGFAIMYFFYLFGKIFTRLRARRLEQSMKETEEALGSGDVTLTTILGLFLGWPLTWFGILLGVLFAGFISLILILALLATRKYRQQVFMIFIPFGPAFILSTIILIYLPNWINKVLPG
jgi:leader peptidase (prepilin peptidase)/N-methyltransferase